VGSPTAATPRGDPTKPAPGTPYYVRAPPEPAHDPSKEERDVKLGVGEDRGRLPVLGCDAAHAAIAIPLGYRHIRCGGSDDPHLSAVAAAIAAAGPVGGRDALFVSAKLSPSDVASGDVAAATAAILASLKIQKLDLLSIEWPTGDAATLARTWSALEALVASGKTTAIGLANASVPVVESVCKAATIKPVVNEVEAHPLMAHRKLVGVCRRYGVVAAAHAPLGGLHATLLTHPKLLEAAMLGEGGAEKDGRGVDGKKSAEELLARWSAQRGVPFALDAGASEETVRAVANVHAFRLTNSQKVLIDGMEPPPREGGVRFVNPPAGIDFAFDDPFLGGVARPGLDLEKAGAL
jgi:diketogulonate reductase-like aldo/keto reductase